MHLRFRNALSTSIRLFAKVCEDMQDASPAHTAATGVSRNSKNSYAYSETSGDQIATYSCCISI